MAKQRIDDLFMLLTQYNQERLSALRNQMVSACHAAWSPEKCERAVAQNADY